MTKAKLLDHYTVIKRINKHLHERDQSLRVTKRSHPDAAKLGVYHVHDHILAANIPDVDLVKLAIQFKAVDPLNELLGLRLPIPPTPKPSYATWGVNYLQEEADEYQPDCS